MYWSSPGLETFTPLLNCKALKSSLILSDSTPFPNDIQLYQDKPIVESHNFVEKKNIEPAKVESSFHNSSVVFQSKDKPIDIPFGKFTLNISPVTKGLTKPVAFTFSCYFFPF